MKMNSFKPPAQARKGGVRTCGGILAIDRRKVAA